VFCDDPVLRHRNPVVSMTARAALRQMWRCFTPATLLYAPANDQRKVERADAFGAQAVILDLEDSVPLNAKDQARLRASSQLRKMRSDVLRFVRVNNLETGFTQEDIETVLGNDLDGLVYPKIQSNDELFHVDQVIEEAEGRLGIPIGETVLIVLIETSAAVSGADQLLATVPSRLLTVGFGVVDYALDMRITLSETYEELSYPRARVATAARAAGLANALDGPWVRITDIDGLRSDTRRSRSLGFSGRQLIHPSHIEPTRHAYQAISSEQASHFRRVVLEFESALLSDHASIQVDGQLVDYPVYAHAKFVLENPHSFESMATDEG